MKGGWGRLSQDVAPVREVNDCWIEPSQQMHTSWLGFAQLLLSMARDVG